MIKRKNKAILCAIASIALVNTAVAVPASAMSNDIVEAKASKSKKEMVAKVNDLNVRTGSSTKHKVLGKLNKGDKVTVAQTLSNGWVKIEYKGGFGYVSNVKGAYLETVSSSKPDVPSVPENTKKEMVAKVDDLNVRTGSSTKHKVIGKLNKGDKATVVQTLSNGWVKIEYKGGFGYVSNVKGAYLQLVDNTQDKESADRVIALINSLNSNITLADKDAVVKARDAYNALSEKAKALVTNLDKLTDAEEEITKLEKDKVDSESSQEVITIIDEIEALTNISLSDKDLIARARTAYNNLSPEAKVMVAPETLAILEEAEEKIAELEKEEVDKASAKKVEDKIATLDREIVYSDINEIKSIRKVYEALNNEAKAFVANLNILEDAENKFQAIIDRIHKVDSLINKIPDDVSLDDEALIVEAKNAYDSLKDDEKNAIFDIQLGVLMNAEAKLEKLIAIRDNVNVQEAIESIEKIPSVDAISLDDNASIKEARARYNALPEELKFAVDITALEKAEDRLYDLMPEYVQDMVRTLSSIIKPGEEQGFNIYYIEALTNFVTDYNSLTEEEKPLVCDSSKVAEYETILEALKKADVVIDMINELPEAEHVRITDKADIESVRNAYDLLSEDESKYVDNHNKLVALEEKIVELENAISQITVDEVIEKINNLPEVVDIDWKHNTEINDARDSFNALSHDNQALVTNSSKLDSAEAEWNRINDGINEVITAIHKIPALEDITVADKDVVVEARRVYDSHNEKVTYYVNQINSVDLINAEIKMEKLEGLLNDAEANSLVQRIDALSKKEITLADKDTVIELRNDYYALAPEDRKSVV